MLFFYCSSSLVCDPWLVVVGCLQVWASCMSFFMFVVFFRSFFFCFLEADVCHLSRSVKSKHRSLSKERNTQIKIVFLSTQKERKNSWVQFLRNFHLMMFIFLKVQITVFICSPESLFLQSTVSSSDVRILGAVSIELCQSKHEIIQMKSPLSDLHLFLPQRRDS